MDYLKFINKRVTNKYGEEGIVMSFDKDYLLIRYEEGEKKYQTETVLKNKFLSFIDDDLNKEIDIYLLDKEQQDALSNEDIKKNHKIAIERNKKVNEHFLKLEKKNKEMKMLFGKDFLYPPYVEFLKKYKGLIRKEDTIFGKLNWVRLYQYD